MYGTQQALMPVAFNRSQNHPSSSSSGLSRGSIPQYSQPKGSTFVFESLAVWIPGTSPRMTKCEGSIKGDTLILPTRYPRQQAPGAGEVGDVEHFTVYVDDACLWGGDKGCDDGAGFFYVLR